MARGAAARVVHAERPALGRVGHGDEKFLGGEGVGYYGAGLWLWLWFWFWFWVAVVGEGGWEEGMWEE